jgi:hypothetical protein
MSAKPRRDETIVSLWIVEGNAGLGWAPVVDSMTQSFVGAQTEKAARKCASVTRKNRGWKVRVREFRSVVRRKSR